MGLTLGILFKVDSSFFYIKTKIIINQTVFRASQQNTLWFFFVR